MRERNDGLPLYISQLRTETSTQACALVIGVEQGSGQGVGRGAPKTPLTCLGKEKVEQQPLRVTLRI